MNNQPNNKTQMTDSICTQVQPNPKTLAKPSIKDQLTRCYNHRSVVDTKAAMARSKQLSDEQDAETTHLSYRPRLEPDTRLSDDILHLAKHMGTSRFHQGHRVHRRNKSVDQDWSKGLMDLPSEAAGPAKDKGYEHGPLPKPMQTLLFQWKNTKQSRKWASKQISWKHLMTAMHSSQKTGDAAMLRWEELKGDDLTPTSGDPMDALIQAEQNVIIEESRQYKLALLLRSITKRQRKALEWKTQGLTEQQISKKMRVSQPTINREIAKIQATAATLARF